MFNQNECTSLMSDLIPTLYIQTEIRTFNVKLEKLQHTLNISTMFVDYILFVYAWAASLSPLHKFCNTENKFAKKIPTPFVRLKNTNDFTYFLVP